MKKLFFTLAAVGVLALSAPQAANADPDHVFVIKCVGSDVAPIVNIIVITESPNPVAIGVDLCLGFHGHPAGVSIQRGS